MLLKFLSPAMCCLQGPEQAVGVGKLAVQELTSRTADNVDLRKTVYKTEE